MTVKVSKWMYCPTCKRVFKTRKIYPLSDKTDIAVCPNCNDILEFKDSEQKPNKE